MAESAPKGTGIRKPRVFEPQPRPRKFLTVPNLMSIGRMLLLIPLFIFLHKGPRENGDFWALVMMAAALISDMLDGLVARWFHVESDWGRVLDPLADKTWLGFLALFLAMPWRENPLPWQFLIIMIARDLAIVVGSYFVFRKHGLVMQASYLGKFTMFVIALTLISYTVNWVPGIAPWLKPETMVYASTALVILSGIHYFYLLTRYLRTSSEVVD
jgi:cardiolipin synthase